MRWSLTPAAPGCNRSPARDPPYFKSKVLRLLKHLRKLAGMPVLHRHSRRPFFLITHAPIISVLFELPGIHAGGDWYEPCLGKRSCFPGTWQRRSRRQCSAAHSLHQRQQLRTGQMKSIATRSGSLTRLPRSSPKVQLHQRFLA